MKSIIILLIFVLSLSSCNLNTSDINTKNKIPPASENMNWVPQVCSANGLDVVFVGAKFQQGEVYITLNGLNHISAENWMDNSEYSVTEPEIPGDLPSIFDFVWYSKIERTGYQIKDNPSIIFPKEYFNKFFERMNSYKLQFCMGFKGNLYVFLSNGEERVLLDILKAEKIDINNVESNIDFTKMSDLHENRMKERSESYENLISLQETFENSLNDVSKIHLTLESKNPSFIKLYFKDKQIKIISSDSLKENSIFNFPVGIDIYDAQINLISRIDLTNEFNKYSKNQNKKITITGYYTPKIIVSDDN